MSQPTTKKETNLKHKILTIVGAVLCVILIPVLIINMILIVKSYTNSEEVPSVAGIFPMIVLTDSMSPVIYSGDLIICQTAEPEDIQVEDVITFFDPAGNGSSVVTHRVLEIKNENGELSFVTKGDFNNTPDQMPVPAENLLGKYSFRIAGAGHIAMFMQTTPGLIVCVVLPIVLLVGYDLLRRRKFDKAKQQDTDALLAELEALRAMKAEKEKESEAEENGEG